MLIRGPDWQLASLLQDTDGDGLPSAILTAWQKSEIAEVHTSLRLSWARPGTGEPMKQTCLRPVSRLASVTARQAKACTGAEANGRRDWMDNLLFNWAWNSNSGFPGGQFVAVLCCAVMCVLLRVVSASSAEQGKVALQRAPQHSPSPPSVAWFSLSQARGLSCGRQPESTRGPTQLQQTHRLDFTTTPTPTLHPPFGLQWFNGSVSLRFTLCCRVAAMRTRHARTVNLENHVKHSGRYTPFGTGCE